MAKKSLIAIVDDDESIRVSTANLIRAFGFAARGFASAEEFLQSPELGETSCVISDVQMQGIGGLELQSRLASTHRRTPIIFITAQGDDKLRLQALRAGAVEFLTKAFDDQALLDSVRAALET